MSDDGTPPGDVERRLADLLISAGFRAKPFSTSIFPVPNRPGEYLLVFREGEDVPIEPLKSLRSIPGIPGAWVYVPNNSEEDR